MSIATVHHNVSGHLVQEHANAKAARVTNKDGDWIEVALALDGTFEIRCSEACAIEPNGANNFHIKAGR